MYGVIGERLFLSEWPHDALKPCRNKDMALQVRFSGFPRVFFLNHVCHPIPEPAANCNIDL